MMGSFLTLTEQEPELVVSSSAVRALTTAQLAAEAGGWGSEPRVEPQLYGASRSQVLEAVRTLDDTCSSVLLAGHEPTFSDLAGGLVGSAQIRLPTAALACIEVPVGRWRSVELGVGVLIWLVTPKLLESAGLRAA
jgi:phosphohistidine phosphatase